MVKSFIKVYLSHYYDRCLVERSQLLVRINSFAVSITLLEFRRECKDNNMEFEDSKAGIGMRDS